MSAYVAEKSEFPITILEADSGISPLSPMPPEMSKVLGQGAYGIVRVGIVSSTTPGSYLKIAVKEICKKDLIPRGATMRQVNEPLVSMHKEGNVKLDAKSLNRVQREVALQSSLRHPNIIRILGTHETVDRVYIFMELAKRKELFNLIVKKKKISEVIAATMFWQLLSAVEHCHMNGVLHRDIKPENIMLDRDYNVKLTDFGFANALDDTEGLEEATLSGTCGSPTYAAPEIFKSLPHDGSVDVWSMGVTLYVMVTGKSPWGSEKNTLRTKMGKILEARYVEPEGISPHCLDLIAACLRVDPASRIRFAEMKAHPWFQANLPGWAQVQLFGPLRDLPETPPSEDFSELRSSRSGGSSNSSFSSIGGGWRDSSEYLPSPLGASRGRHGSISNVNTDDEESASVADLRPRRVSTTQSFGAMIPSVIIEDPEEEAAVAAEDGDAPMPARRVATSQYLGPNPPPEIAEVADEGVVWSAEPASLSREAGGASGTLNGDSKPEQSEKQPAGEEPRGKARNDEGAHEEGQEEGNAVETVVAVALQDRERKEVRENQTLQGEDNHSLGEAPTAQTQGKEVVISEGTERKVEDREMEPKPVSQSERDAVIASIEAAIASKEKQARETAPTRASGENVKVSRPLSARPSPVDTSPHSSRGQPPLLLSAPVSKETSREISPLTSPAAPRRAASRADALEAIAQARALLIAAGGASQMASPRPTSAPITPKGAPSPRPLTRSAAGNLLTPAKSLDTITGSHSQEWLSSKGTTDGPGTGWGASTADEAASEGIQRTSRLHALHSSLGGSSASGSGNLSTVPGGLASSSAQPLSSMQQLTSLQQQSSNTSLQQQSSMQQLSLLQPTFHSQKISVPEKVLLSPPHTFRKSPRSSSAGTHPGGGGADAVAPFHLARAERVEPVVKRISRKVAQIPAGRPAAAEEGEPAPDLRQGLASERAEARPAAEPSVAAMGLGTAAQAQASLSSPLPLSPLIPMAGASSSSAATVVVESGAMSWFASREEPAAPAHAREVLVLVADEPLAVPEKTIMRKMPSSSSSAQRAAAATRRLLSRRSSASSRPEFPPLIVNSSASVGLGSTFPGLQSTGVGSPVSQVTVPSSGTGVAASSSSSGVRAASSSSTGVGEASS